MVDLNSKHILDTRTNIYTLINGKEKFCINNTALNTDNNNKNITEFEIMPKELHHTINNRQFKNVYDNIHENLLKDLLDMGEMIDPKNKNISELEIIESKQCLSNSYTITNAQSQNIYDRLFFKPIGDTPGIKKKYSNEIKNLYTQNLIEDSKKSPDTILTYIKTQKKNSIEEKLGFCIEEIQPVKREFDIKTNKRPSSEELSLEPDEDIEKMMEVKKKITYEKIIQTFFGLIKKESFNNKIIFESVLRRRKNHPYTLTG